MLKSSRIACHFISLVPCQTMYFLSTHIAIICLGMVCAVYELQKGTSKVSLSLYRKVFIAGMTPMIEIAISMKTITLRGTMY